MRQILYYIIYSYNKISKDKKINILPIYNTMGVDFYKCDSCDECIGGRMYHCKSEKHSICHHCIDCDEIKLYVIEDDTNKEIEYHDGLNDDDYDYSNSIYIKTSDCAACLKNEDKKQKVKQILKKYVTDKDEFSRICQKICGIFF
jgi:hypothetical protein